MKTRQQPEAVFLKDYQKPPYLIPETELWFDLREKHTRVRSRLHMTRHLESLTPCPLKLNGEKLKLIEILLNGKRLEKTDYDLTSEYLTLPNPPRDFILEIETEIEPQENKAFEGLYKSRKAFCTQNESEGFRKMTYFLDRPDVMSRFTTTITADLKKYPVLLSNGNLAETRKLSSGRHQTVWKDPFPKPCYLFALVAGDLGNIQDQFVTRSGRTIELRIYVDKGNEKRAGYAMECLKKAMKWDEETFGLEYDLDLYMIVAVNDFNFGAMENKGLNIFNSQYVLADPRTATDQNFQAILGVIGHEYFHNWTGNRVTCRDWFQITLKEGLTVFRDQEFSSDMTSRAVRRIEEVRHLKDYQFSEDSGPNSHPIRPASYIEINNFYTTTVYQKGAEVVRMIQTLIGKENFVRGLEKYFELFDGQAVTTDDFVHAMELASGMDLTQFRRWYEQAGTPVCRVNWRYDAKAKRATLDVSQKTIPASNDKTPKRPLFFPLTVSLLNAQGKGIPLYLKGDHQAGDREKVLVISKPKERFVFERVGARPVPSLLRYFSAPVKLKTNLTQEEQIFLMSHDTDPINRSESASALLMQEILRLIKWRKKGKKMPIDPQILQAVSKVLKDKIMDPALAAEMLVPPSEAAIQEHLIPCDFDAVHVCREFVLQGMASAFENDWMRLYKMGLSVKPDALDGLSIGRRTLKNLALRYLSFLKKSEYLKLCGRQFEASSRNMTDQLAALSILCDFDSDISRKVLKAFYQKWKKDPVVLNKWFAVQAGSRRPDVLDQVKKLEKDPAFDPKNPNNQRALYGVFSANLVRFHDPSGAGYRFFADKIIQINTWNPGSAGKLAVGFKKFSCLDAGRQLRMRRELERILRTPGMSKDVFEILSKTLRSGGKDPGRKKASS